MRIDEVINEVEFGAAARGIQSLKTGAQKLAGKVSRGAAKAAIKGDIKGQAMQGANNISSAYTKWLTVNHPNESEQVLNLELFKEFMSTSPKIKSQVENPEFLKLIPKLKQGGAIATSWKNSSEQEPLVIADRGHIQSIFLALAQSQFQTTSSGSRQEIAGGSKNPEELQKMQNAVGNMSKEQQISLFNILKNTVS